MIPLSRGVSSSGGTRTSAPRRKSTYRRAKTAMTISKKVRVAPLGDVKKAQVMKVVKNILDRRVEDKFAGGIVENSYGHNCGITNSDIYPLVPPVAKGTDYNQRVGDKIRPKYMIYRVRVALTESGMNDVKPIRVRLLCLTSKSQKYAPSIGSTVDTAHLLDGGSGSTAFDGQTINSFLPVNRDYFTPLHDRNFVLSAATSEDHRCMSRTLTFKIKCPAHLTYEDASGNYPTNFGPFTCVGWSYDDGTLPAVPFTYTPIVVTSWVDLHYEDA